MNIFYAPTIEAGQLILSEEEARHCVQVLRHKSGDIIQVVDGKGGRYVGQISTTGKRQCSVDIVEQEIQPANRAIQLHLAIAPTKNINRFEWLLEKATEIGIEYIHPLLCEHSERKKIRKDRLERILVAAMKQSQRAHLPVLTEMTSFSDFLEQLPPDTQRFIAHCVDGPKMHLQNQLIPGKDIVILVGPEGDFSPAEIEEAVQHEFVPVHLGQTRLRTETAGLFACSIVQLKNEPA